MDIFVKEICTPIATQHQWNITAIETDIDHLQLLLEYDTTTKVCDIIRILKQQTTHFL